MTRTTINNLCFISPELISGMCAGGGPARFSEPASPQTVPLFPLPLQDNLDRFPVFFVAGFRDADFDPVRRWPVAARMCHCATDSAIAHHITEQSVMRRFPPDAVAHAAPMKSVNVRKAIDRSLPATRMASYADCQIACRFWLTLDHFFTFNPSSTSRRMGLFRPRRLN